MAQIKEIQRRIKSINSTKKITKAMEMVAAAKMRRAIEAVLKTRTYANLSWETVLHLSNQTLKKDKTSHPLLSKREAQKKAAMILITSNRGLCGAYNLMIINKAKESLKKYKDLPVEFILLGKKGASIYTQKQVVAAEFPKSDLLESTQEIASLSNLVINDFLSAKYDKVLLAYTDYINPSKQVPRIKQLLPVEIDSQEEYLGVIEGKGLGLSKEMIKEKEAKHAIIKGETNDYIFEPNPREVLDKMIPRLIEVQIFQAILEANASEHSARMSAMHQASEAAGDMVKELQLYYNKARQAGITAEIAEISAGANALLEQE